MFFGMAFRYLREGWQKYEREEFRVRVEYSFPYLAHQDLFIRLLVRLNDIITAHIFSMWKMTFMSLCTLEMTNMWSQRTNSYHANQCVNLLTSSQGSQVRYLTYWWCPIVDARHVIAKRRHRACCSCCGESRSGYVGGESGGVKSQVKYR